MQHSRRAPQVVEIQDDEDEDEPKESKRGASASNNATNLQLKKRARFDNTQSDTRLGTMKLFATVSDVAERLKHPDDKTHWSHSQCWTLREMLGFDGNRVHSPIDWLVVCNYMIDFEFLLDEVPEVLSIGQLVAFFGIADSPWDVWKSAIPTSDFVRLNPSDPPRTFSNPTHSRIPYGVHHTKMFLIGFSDRTLRVVIHTANLRYNDIHLKAQGAFVQDFPTKQESSHSSDFESSLVRYLESYCYRTTNALGETLVSRIQRYDFSSASVILIPSIPGYHQPDGRLGHLALSKAVKTHASYVDRNCRIVCQFSSIGSLTEKYLCELGQSMSATGSRNLTPDNLNIRLVYPTVQEIRTSIQGYRGGGSVPGTLKNVSKAFLGRLFCRWSSRPVCSPLCKPDNVPHIKSYFQVCPDGQSLSWFVLSSHNLSKAAWGDIVSRRYEGNRLFIRHWELGVFFHAKPGQRLVPWTEASDDTRDLVMPIPFSINPEPYHEEDIPWAIDMLLSQPDIFGRTSAHDP